MVNPVGNGLFTSGIKALVNILRMQILHRVIFILVSPPVAFVVDRQKLREETYHAVNYWYRDVRQYSMEKQVCILVAPYLSKAVRLPNTVKKDSSFVWRNYFLQEGIILGNLNTMHYQH